MICGQKGCPGVAGRPCGAMREPEAAPGMSGSERSQDDGADEGKCGARGNNVDVTHVTHG